MDRLFHCMCVPPIRNQSTPKDPFEPAKPVPVTALSEAETKAMLVFLPEWKQVNYRALVYIDPITLSQHVNCEHWFNVGF
jgi:hypothetical protein